MSIILFMILLATIMLPGEVQETLAALSGLLDAHAAILRPVRPAARVRMTGSPGVTATAGGS